MTLWADPNNLPRCACAGQEVAVSVEGERQCVCGFGVVEERRVPLAVNAVDPSWVTRRDEEHVLVSRLSRDG